MARAVLFAPDLDDHLLEAGHDGGGSKVAKVRHTVARTQRQACRPWPASVQVQSHGRPGWLYHYLPLADVGDGPGNDPSSAKPSTKSATGVVLWAAGARLPA